MKPLTALELIENFDRLPNDAVVPTTVTAALTNMSEWTLRRHLRKVRLSPRRCGFRVGDIRALVRGEQSAA
jgi:hypothetical protein